MAPFTPRLRHVSLLLAVLAAGLGVFAAARADDGGDGGRPSATERDERAAARADARARAERRAQARRRQAAADRRQLRALVRAQAAARARRADDPAGRVRFVKRTGPEFDRYTTRSTARFRSWMDRHFWRAVVFTPYFDDKTGWYRRGWVYRDLYGIHPGSPTARHHPGWLLRGMDGRRRYVPWDCSGGRCPLLAADVGNPAYRRGWIRWAKRTLAKGYRGLWIDDVNLDFRVGDGSGAQAPPRDPRTGREMTAAAWRGYVATFLEQIRRALPGVEIVHNAIWYAGEEQRDANADVRRAIAAADWVNLEHGVNDAGLTGGDGEWSLSAFLAYVDRVHRAGRGVVLEGRGDDTGERAYALAAYFLVSTGRDGIGVGEMTPRTWWRGYDVRLGAPLGPRTDDGGLFRRDFSGGTVLLNEPGAAPRTVALDRRLKTLSGRIVTSVTLGPRDGVVLLRP